MSAPTRQRRLGTVGFDSPLTAVAWHPKQHVVALGSFGDNAPITLYCRESSSSM
jgi:hypothetical protein